MSGRDWILVSTPVQVRLTCDDIADRLIESASAVYGVSNLQIKGYARMRPLPEVRNAIAHLIRKHTRLSNTAISLSLGRTDHTTGAYNLKAAEERIKNDPGFVAKLYQIEARVAA